MIGTRLGSLSDPRFYRHNRMMLLQEVYRRRLLSQILLLVESPLCDETLSRERLLTGSRSGFCIGGHWIKLKRFWSFGCFVYYGIMQSGRLAAIQQKANSTIYCLVSWVCCTLTVV